MVPLCSLGLFDTAGGKAEEKFHSSSSLADATVICWKDVGVEAEARAANGSADAWLAGGGFGCC